MAKKIIFLLSLTLILSLFLCACGEEAKPVLSAKDFDLNAETAETIQGVKIGDNSETFLAAYRDYDILSSIDGGDYRFLAAEEIPFTSQLTTILPSFFVDGSAIDLDSFCEENSIEKEALLSFLTDETYLKAHTVLYQYLVFTWKDGVITEIRSEAMDYNRDGSYYEAN